jgi:hypothetical protein
MLYTLVLVLSFTSGPSERLYLYGLNQIDCHHIAIWATSNVHLVKGADTMTAYCDKTPRT